MRQQKNKDRAGPENRMKERSQNAVGDRDRGWWEIWILKGGTDAILEQPTSGGDGSREHLWRHFRETT